MVWMHYIKGIEFDFIYKILPNLSVEGLLSLGDWRWKSGRYGAIFR